MNVVTLLKYAIGGALLLVVVVVVKKLMAYRNSLKARLGVPTQHLQRDRTLLRACQQIKPFFVQDRTLAPHFKEFVQFTDRSLGAFADEGKRIDPARVQALKQRLAAPTNTALVDTHRLQFSNLQKQIEKLLNDLAE